MGDSRGLQRSAPKWCLKTPSRFPSERETVPSTSGTALCSAYPGLDTIALMFSSKAAYRWRAARTCVFVGMQVPQNCSMLEQENSAFDAGRTYTAAADVTAWAASRTGVYSQHAPEHEGFSLAAKGACD